MHAGVALLAALDHRRRTGEGQLIEVAQIEVGAAVTAEPVIEYSMNGVVLPREGNRRRGCRQGVYPTDSDDAWVALSVRDDTDWSQLVRAMARPDLTADDHEAFDEAVAAWTRTQSAANVVAALREHNIPAEEVTRPERMYQLPGLDARGFYEIFEHAGTSHYRYPGWPFRINPGPALITASPRPRLGSTTTRSSAVSGFPDELDALRRDM